MSNPFFITSPSLDYISEESDYPVSLPSALRAVLDAMPPMRRVTAVDEKTDFKEKVGENSKNKENETRKMSRPASERSLISLPVRLQSAKSKNRLELPKVQSVGTIKRENSSQLLQNGEGTRLSKSASGFFVLEPAMLPPTCGPNISFQSNVYSQQTPKHAYFQQCVADATEDQISVINFGLKVHCYYDGYGYSNSEAVPRLGTLPMIFMHYAKQANPMGGGLTFENIKTANLSLNFAEVLLFAKEFNCFPDMCDKGDVFTAYGSVQQGRSEDGNSDLYYPEFLKVLVLVADKIYSKEKFKSKFPTSLSRVREFCTFLGLDSHKNIKSKLENFALAKLKLKKSESQGSINPPPNIFKTSYLRAHSGNPHTSFEPPKAISQECINALKVYDVDFLPENWVSYHGPMIDMGTVSRNSSVKFKITVQNCSKSFKIIQCDTRDVPFVRVQYPVKPLAVGTSRSILVFMDPSDINVGEHVCSLGVSLQPVGTSCNNENVVWMNIPIYLKLVDDNQLHKPPTRSIPGLASLFNVKSPRLRTAFHPDELHQKHMINMIEEENVKSRKLVQVENAFALPTKEELFFQLNPAPSLNSDVESKMKLLRKERDWSKKGKDDRDSATSFVELAEAKILRNEMEKELSHIMVSPLSPIPNIPRNKSFSTNDTSVKTPEAVRQTRDRNARKTLTKLLVGDVFSDEKEMAKMQSNLRTKRSSIFTKEENEAKKHHETYYQMELASTFSKVSDLASGSADVAAAMLQRPTSSANLFAFPLSPSNFKRNSMTFVPEIKDPVPQNIQSENEIEIKI